MEEERREIIKLLKMLFRPSDCIRFILAIGLLFSVYKETGIWTLIFAAWTTISVESFTLIKKIDRLEGKL